MTADFEQTEEFSERRREKEKRWNIPVPVRVKGTLPDGTAFEEECVTSDASPGGMCLLIPRGIRVKDTLVITAPEEQFEAPATVVSVSPLGENLHRVRVRFNPPAKFNRQAAAKKYIYDYGSDNWVGYLMAGTYYNSKHEAFGRVQGETVVEAVLEHILFHLKGDKVYDTRGNLLGHLI